MLLELRVENLGIISELGLVLGGGMSAITGETGAGKTLIVDALDLLVGGRADASVVRDGAEEARVEGRFAVGDDEVVLARVIPVVGRSRAYVDGRLAPASDLAALGATLVDLHGQHSHQSLLAGPEQRRTLDRFAGSPIVDALTRLRTARTSIAAIERDREALGGDERTRAREIDLLRFQVEEIAAADIRDPLDDAVLEAEEAALADADARRDALQRALASIADGAVESIGDAVESLVDRSGVADLEARLRSLQAEASDVAHDVRVALDGAVSDPDRLEVIRLRRQLFSDLRRKYGETLGDVLEYAGEASDRLAALVGHEDAVAALETQRIQHLAVATRAAEEITAQRAAACAPFSTAVTERLRQLALPKATFSVRVDPAPMSDDGADAIEFLLAPNAGEEARPLARAASGGELSRTMLAVRVVLSEAPPTLVFDEVDAGIGGEAGAAVGRALAELGEKHQVLVVTHLAQVAAFADHQLVVAKDERDGRTVAAVRPTTGEDRVEELARMMAGMRASDSARVHARELLATAESAKLADRGAR